MCPVFPPSSKLKGRLGCDPTGSWGSTVYFIPKHPLGSVLDQQTWINHSLRYQWFTKTKSVLILSLTSEILSCHSFLSNLSTSFPSLSFTLELLWVLLKRKGINGQRKKAASSQGAVICPLSVWMCFKLAANISKYGDWSLKSNF